MTDPLGQSQVIPYLQGLSKAGYDVSILSFEKKKQFSETKTRIQNILDSSNIKWYPQLYTKRPPVLSTIWDIYILFRATHRIIRQQQIDILHCRSYISSLAGLYFKRKYSIKFIFDMRGLWADERVDGGLWDISNRFYKYIFDYFKNKEIQFLQESDAVVSLTQVAKDDILTWPQVKILPDKIKIIPCCVDTELFSPQADVPLAVQAKCQIVIQLVFLYVRLFCIERILCHR